MRCRAALVGAVYGPSHDRSRLDVSSEGEEPFMNAFQKLLRDHRKLDLQIAREQKQRVPDYARLSMLKKVKLMLKDRMLMSARQMA
jgi:uncharacterized protein YdcH (DUF465 family)